MEISRVNTSSIDIKTTLDKANSMQKQPVQIMQELKRFIRYTGGEKLTEHLP